MLSTTIAMTALVVVLALVFDFINGFHDTANAIATSVSTRVLSPQAAVVMSAVCNFTGAFISVKVAMTIGSGIVNPNQISQGVVVAALLGAIIWNLTTWYLGLPSSSSHALIGGLLGAAIVFKGSLMVVNWSTLWWKVLLWLFLSPVIGFIAGFILMTALNWTLKSLRPATVTSIFSKAQVVSAALMALNHGGNDAQKSMGVIALALFSGGLIAQFGVPLWVKASCALAMALGTSLGGWKIIKTMGVSMTRLVPVNGFAAETGAAAIIFTATMLNAPVSTTHIISTAIMGVAASKRLSSVRWIIARNIVWAWVLTIPVCALLAGALLLAIKFIF
ncbi:MAG: inorganic phosphate transporter [Thermacetogeniaceae bacterium]